MGKTKQGNFRNSEGQFLTLSYTKPKWQHFRLLGPIVDPQLKMDVAVEAIRNKALPRLQAIVASMQELGHNTSIQLYKSQVRSVLECFTPAIYHAEKGFLNRLDDAPNKFFHFLKRYPEISDLEIQHGAADLGKGHCHAWFAVQNCSNTSTGTFPNTV